MNETSDFALRADHDLVNVWLSPNAPKAPASTTNVIPLDFERKRARTRSSR